MSKNIELLKQLLNYSQNLFRLFTYLIRGLVMMVIEIHEGRKFEKIPGTHSRIYSLLKRNFYEFLGAEVTRYLVKTALLNKRPVVYANFAGYDEIAHQYGPNSKPAIVYLSFIDHLLRDLVTLTEKLPDYHILILSDHGQTSSQPIKIVMKKTLGHYLAELYPDIKIQEFGEGKSGPLDPQTVLAILASGSLALIYFVKNERKLNHSEIDHQLRDFCRNLSLTPGIGFVISRERKQALVSKAGKTYRLTKTNVHSLLKYKSSFATDFLYSSLHSLLGARFGADVYIFADFVNKDTIYTFESQYGTHGGYGGRQTESFVLTDMTHDLIRVRELVDIHQLIYE